ncbi:hypothetical protein [Selenomonas sp. TAMA-11512]
MKAPGFAQMRRIYPGDKPQAQRCCAEELSTTRGQCRCVKMGGCMHP